MLRESIRMSWENILGNRMRSFLTTLGIIIGVLAVITLITVMNAATGEVMNQFEALGAGMVTVQVPGTPLKRGLSARDLRDIAAIPYVSGISPETQATLSVVHGAALAEDVSVQGSGYAYFVRGNAKVSRGRPFGPIDEEQALRVCVVDHVLAQNLFGGRDPVGQHLLINGRRLYIIGVLEKPAQENVMAQAAGGGDNGRVLMPYTTFMRLQGQSLIGRLSVYIADTAQTQHVIEALGITLQRAHNYRDDSYSIINLESLLDTMDTMLGLMTGLLAGIAGISLMVGGIGIMNMMLVSVTERTNEIGLRKALGARAGSIQLQFLLESVMLSFIGGFVGMSFGLLLSWGMCRALGIPFAVSPGAIGLGVGFSFLVGVLFGWAPARKASVLNPIDALRSM